VKTINLSFNPFPSHLHILPDEIQWPNLNTLCLNGSHISLEMIIEVLKKTPKSVKRKKQFVASVSELTLLTTVVTMRRNERNKELFRKGDYVPVT
jgi:hypothetical protein